MPRLSPSVAPLARTIRKRRGLRTLLKSILLVVAFSGSACVMASTVHAQSMSRDYSLSNWTPSATRWWSPEGTEFTAAPHLVLAGEYATRLTAAGFSWGAVESPSLLCAPRSEAANLNESTSYSAVPVVRLDFDTPKMEQSVFDADPRSASNTFFGSLETRYFGWESRIADSSRPVSVNQTFVYPLLQIKVERETLPVTLYVTPLRGDVTAAR
jgi:hypothetical protein